MSTSQLAKKSKFWVGLWIYLGVLLAAELLVERHSHFGHHGIDASFGFFAFLGFVASVVCILFALLIAMVLRVKESYYE